jgi:16S rRNA (cytosine967-C5)-methyltransferase
MNRCKKTALSPRADAATIVAQVVAQKKSLNEVLCDYAKKYEDPRDQALLQELSYGTLRWHYKLDAIAKSLLTKTTKKTDVLVYALIMVGLYQLLQLRIPHHAILFETVAATHIIKKSWAATLVNAILRNFIRQQENILAQIEKIPLTKYSHPEWLIKLLQESFSTNWAEILSANNERPPMHLRVNLQKISCDAYLKKLESLGIAAKIIQNSKTAITLEKPVDINKLPGFYDGLVSVQDLSAQYVVDLLELKPGLRVLDACAAPGGKTAHILENTRSLQELVAVDITDERLEMIQDNLKRLQLSATLILGDATKPEQWWHGKKFDRILLDAPCSGTGVIRRHPDIKILRQFKDIAANASLQLKLLETLWPLLEKQGILVYATCSILPQENHMVIEKFLHKYNNAQEETINADWGHKNKFGRQIFPQNDSGDGFYYAKILKVS